MALVATGNETAGVVDSPVFAQTAPRGIVFALEERGFPPQGRENAPGHRFQRKLGHSGNALHRTTTLAATDDSVNEATGSITLTVLPGNGYALGDRSSATTGVKDCGVPDSAVSPPATTPTAAERHSFVDTGRRRVPQYAPTVPREQRS